MRSRPAAFSEVAIALVGLAQAACAEPAAVVSGGPGGASAQLDRAEVPAVSQGRLDRGLELFQDLEYTAAIQVLRPVRLDPDVTRSQKLRALELIGIGHLILGERARAAERLPRPSRRADAPPAVDRPRWRARFTPPSSTWGYEVDDYV